MVLLMQPAVITPGPGCLWEPDKYWPSPHGLGVSVGSYTFPV